MKKIYSITITFALIATSLVIAPASEVYAQCVPGETPGNLYGYAMTDEIGAIYMSTETWNDDPLSEGHATTSEEFFVSYDRQLDLWSGRGWNPHVGWVDFGDINAANITARTAEFESIKNNPAAWGNWDPLVDLSPVVYETDPGGFEGFATNGDYTIGGGDGSNDDYVGAGNIDFSNVGLQVVPSTCDEAVNVLLNGVNILYNESCSISAPTIQWTSVDVSNCQTSAGLWSSPGLRGTTGSETASGSITTGNTPLVFRLKCIGDGSGADVFGTAIASCGTGPDIIDPTTGIVIPEFKEV